MLDTMNVVIPIFVMAMFVLVIGVFLFVLFQSISRSRRNAKSPRITAPASLVAKRYSVRAGSAASGAGHAYGRYYMTFEFESGDRMEFAVPSDIYGLSVEGDRGKLTFQGTAFLGFERQ